MAGPIGCRNAQPQTGLSQAVPRRYAAVHAPNAVLSVSAKAERAMSAMLVK